MRAHMMDGDLIANTIEVESLDVFTSLVDADLYGGGPGDSIIDGVLVPKPAPPATPYAELSVAYLNEVRLIRERILARINGYLLRLINNEPPAYAEEKALCETLIAGLLDITTIPSVLAATTMPELEYAVKVEYARLVGLASENLVLAFRQVDV